ncbi:MAG: hypothetical protein HOC74_21595 [Gemmatimonadetes bacterium]|jgi:hypothetical protein|nr:hypothetical protein [Gemmatimonadota bacterium]
MAKHVATREELERVARMYKTNSDACAALSISFKRFAELCRQFDIETPYGRKQRRKRETQRY